MYAIKNLLLKNNTINTKLSKSNLIKISIVILFSIFPFTNVSSYHIPPHTSFVT